MFVSLNCSEKSFQYQQHRHSLHPTAIEGQNAARQRSAPHCAQVVNNATIYQTRHVVVCHRLSSCCEPQGRIGPERAIVGAGINARCVCEKERHSREESNLISNVELSQWAHTLY